MAHRALAMVAVVVAACATPPASDPRREQEIERVHAHLTRVEAELAERAVGELGPAQRAARTAVLANLRAYIAARIYPTNDVAVEQTPIFIDRGGVHGLRAHAIEQRDRARRVPRRRHLVIDAPDPRRTAPRGFA